MRMDMTEAAREPTHRDRTCTHCVMVRYGMSRWAAHCAMPTVGSRCCRRCSTWYKQIVYIMSRKVCLQVITQICGFFLPTLTYGVHESNSNKNETS